MPIAGLPVVNGGRYCENIREIQGPKFTYALLVGITVDSRIEVTLSALALIRLALDFGVEGFLLDDRIPAALLANKQVGKFKSCLVDALCECVAEDSGTDFTEAFALICIDTLPRIRWAGQHPRVAKCSRAGGDSV